jgi:D-sedoheptulose 7-phosphate isomerase
MKKSYNIESYFRDVGKVISGLGKEQKKIQTISKKIAECSKNGNKILVAGNGGSCADADHFVGELVCTFVRRDKKPISAINLNSGPASITAWSNDFDYESFCKRMVEAHGNRNDILFLISTGGGNYQNKASINLVHAAIEAKKKGLKIISLVGKDGGELKKISNEVIIIKNKSTSIIQEAHMSIMHAICYLLEQKL